MRRSSSPVVWYQLAFSLFLVAGYCFYAWLNWNVLLQRQVNRLGVLSGQIERTASDIFSHNINGLRLLGERLMAFDAASNPAAAERLIDDTTQVSQGIVAVSVTDPQGNTIAANGVDGSVDNLLSHRGNEEIFYRALTNYHPVGGRTTYFPELNAWAIPLAMPLLRSDGTVAAVMHVWFSVNPEDTLWRMVNLLPQTTLMIVHEKGYVQFSSDVSDSARSIYGVQLSPKTLSVLGRRTGEVTRMRDLPVCNDCYIAVGRLQANQHYTLLLRPMSAVRQVYAKSMIAPTIMMGVLFLLLIVFYRFFHKLQARYESKLLRMAQYDSLTTLPNRTLALDRLQSSMQLAKREGWKVAVLFVDLDKFKDINDAYGHQAGDELLKVVAARLQANVKDSDTVARFGGDEFVVILQHIQQAQSVERVAERLLAAFAVPVNLQVKDVFVSPSIGIALYPDDALTAADVIKHADTAMYRAKAEGRNCYHAFSHELSRQTSRSLSVSTQLRTALERGELYLVYQPQYDLVSGNVVAAEALCRWESPELGTVSPIEFVPAAEESGLIVDIGEWVIREACAARQSLSREWGSELRMSINVSVRQIRERGFRERVNTIVTGAGARPKQIELEITESLLLDQQALSVVRELREDGFLIAVDDFGTGYAALSYLQRFPVTTLKIDRSFLTEFPDNKDSCALVNAIVSLANTFGLQLIAEGVENDVQKQALQRIGCLVGQGFGLCRPRRVDELVALHAEICGYCEQPENCHPGVLQFNTRN